MIRRKRQFDEKKAELSFETHFRVRFQEADPLGIVWHGHYITYFEDGREAFGREYGISYLDVQSHGFTTPIVKSCCEHKLPLKYGDVARIKTIYVDSLAAKIVFKYLIYNDADEVVCTGETIQVFLDGNGELALTFPAFFSEWKERMGLKTNLT